MHLVHFFIYLNLILIFILLCQNNVLKGGDILANSDSESIDIPTQVPTQVPITQVPITQVPTSTPTPTEQKKIKKLEEELALLKNPYRNIIEKVENVRDWCKTNFEKIMNVQDDRLDDTRMVCNSIL